MVRSGDFLRVPFFLRKNGHESIDSLYTLREFALGLLPGFRRCRGLGFLLGSRLGLLAQGVDDYAEHLFLRGWLASEDLELAGALLHEHHERKSDRHRELAGDFSQTFDRTGRPSLVGDERLLFFDGGNRGMLSVLPKLCQQWLDANRCGYLNFFAGESRNVANKVAILVDAAIELQEPG